MKMIYSKCRNTVCLVAGLITISAGASEASRSFHGVLPTVTIDALEGEVIRAKRSPVSVTVINGTSTNRCQAEISIRGSSSAKRDKQPYRLELQDENGDDLKLSLLGMPKESDWILYPAYTDKTMIRDVLAYELWRQMGYWAPRTRYVHLFIVTNSSSSSSSISNSAPSASSVLNADCASFREFSGDTPGYEGVYILMEKIKRGKNRVNIQKLPRASPASSIEDPACTSSTDNGPLTTDISGGYIFKKDRHNNTNETHFRTSKKIDILIEEPKVRDLTPEQLGWFTNHLNEFEVVLFSHYFADPVIGYKRYVDIDSFVDYHWMQELSKNGDGYWWSEFYTKDRGGKIKIGPIWDCDLYFGNTWYNDGFKTNQWRWERSAGTHYTWYKRMFKDPDFLQRYIDRWSELRTNVLSISNVLGLIDRFAAEISEAQKLNYQRWPTLGQKVGPVSFVGQTWEEEVQWLREWMIGRLAWIDSQDFPKPVFQVVASSNSVSRSLASFAGSSLPPLLSLSSLLSRPSVEDNSASNSSFSPPPSSIIHHPSSLAMTCQPGAGSIFYTTNNSDPRVPGGHASTNAIPYTSPIPIHPGLTVRARVLSEFALWSAPALYH